MSAAALGLGLVVVGCGETISKEQLTAKNTEIAQLQSQLASVQKTSQFWDQLTSALQPVQMPSMSDHRAYMTEGGVVMALHFDAMDLSKAQNLNWVAVGIPGRFCKSDQDRVTKEFGPGFTHFHDMAKDVHGGAPGAEGVWFVHVAVREFDAPWGHVAPGVDMKFMPTPAPDC